MSVESDTRDRVIRLEAEVQNLKEDITEIKEKTAEMYDILNQAKGVRLMTWIVFGGIGFMLSWVPALISYVIPK